MTPYLGHNGLFYGFVVRPAPGTRVEAASARIIDRLDTVRVARK